MPTTKKRGQGAMSFRARRDGRWECRVSLGGTQRSFYGRTKEDARQAALAGADAYDQRQQRGADLTLSELADRWLEARRPPVLRPTTWSSYERRWRLYLKPALGDLPLSVLTAVDGVQLQRSLFDRQLAPTTIALVWAELKTLLSAAVQWGLLAQHPFANLPSPRHPLSEPRVLTPAEVQTVLAAFAEHWLRNLVIVLLGTGLRVGEALGLIWADLDLTASTLRVRRQAQYVVGQGMVLAPPKTAGSYRLIPLSDLVVGALQQQAVWAAQWSEAEPRWVEHDLVFPNTRGALLRYNTVQAAFQRQCQRAGLTGVHLHTLRHTFLTLLAADGAPLRVLMGLAGHTTTAVAVRYQHALDESLVQAVRSIDRLVGLRKEEEDDGTLALREGDSDGA